MNTEVILGVGVFGAIIIALVVTWRQHSTIVALTEKMVEINSNKTALDLAENLATKVVSVEVANSILDFANGVEPLIQSQDIRDLIDQLKKFGQQITDQKPNTTTTTATGQTGSLTITTATSPTLGNGTITTNDPSVASTSDNPTTDTESDANELAQG